MVAGESEGAVSEADSLRPRGRLRSASGSCRGTAPPGARHKALSRESPARQAGRPRPAPPARYAPARCTDANDSDSQSMDFAEPSRAVPVLDGRGRLERATCCGAGAGCGAGKSARRFLAASPVSVIRVGPKRPPAHQCAWHLSPKCIRTRRVVERSERMSRDDFPDRGSRPRTASAGAARARQGEVVRNQ
jgi:hypothetical protein